MYKWGTGGGREEGLEVGSMAKDFKGSLYNVTSIKTQQDKVQRSCGLVYTWSFGESGAAGEGVHTLSHAMPCASLPSRYS